MVAQDRWSLNTSDHKTGFTVIHMLVVIGERAKRARHSQVCSIENRDICRYYSTYVCHIYPLTLSDPYNPQTEWSVILKLLPELFVYLLVLTYFKLCVGTLGGRQLERNVC